MRRGVGVAFLSALAIACGGSRSGSPKPPVATAASEPPAAYPSPEDTLSEPMEYRERAVSPEAGEFYFGEAGVGDPYGAGIPYPAFVTLMRVFPDELGRNWREFNEKFGTIPNEQRPDDPWALPVGFHLTRDPITNVQFLMVNCRVCHAARVVTDDGVQVVTGLGNKRLRIHAYDGALTRIAEHPRFTVDDLVVPSGKVAAALDLSWPHDSRRVILKETIAGFQRRARARASHVRRIGDGLPGRVATIEGFIMALNHQRGAGLDLPRHVGWAKIPDVATWRWRETNSFDAAATGSPVALVAEADFAFGVRSEWYETHRHIPTSMYLYLKTFARDLPYPGRIDVDLARQGKEAFDANCAHCHGRYAAPDAAEKLVAYTETIVPRNVVGTDPVRLDAVTPGLVEAANADRATKGLAVTRKTDGYVPRPLVDVWARGLYGHAGQWPDVAFLALPPEERPRRFVVDLGAPLDLDRLGVRWQRVEMVDDEPEILRDGALVPLEIGPQAYVHDADAAGFDVAGHEYLSRLGPDEQTAVIEYLKTL